MVARRNLLLNIALWLVVVVIILAIFSYIIAFWIGLSYKLPPSTFWMGNWAVLFYVACGIYLFNAMYTDYDKGRGFLDAAFIGSAFMMFAGILCIIFAVYAWSLWAACFAKARTMNAVETLECNNQNWMIWIQSVWSIIYAIMSFVALLALSIDAVLKFNNKRTLSSGNIESIDAHYSKYTPPQYSQPTYVSVPYVSPQTNQNQGYFNGMTHRSK